MSDDAEEIGLYTKPTGSPNASWRAAVAALKENPEREDAWMLRGLLSSIRILEGMLASSATERQ